MAIKMRRGADADFRPEKMQPGELAVTVDGTRKVYAAFAAGDVKELSSKEDVDKTIASGLQSLETSTNNKLQSLEKKASSAVDKISSENQRVQEELSRYEYYTKTESDLKYTVAPRKEASTSTGELKLTDADYGLSYLELQGNSEQYTATGTNLFDIKQMVKNMQALVPSGITIGQDAYGKYMRILNNAYHAIRCLEFTNDITKSYQVGCKTRYVSGSGSVFIMMVRYKDGTMQQIGRADREVEYKQINNTIPSCKEIDYFYFSYGTGGAYYDVLLDSFYLYPEDAPSTEKPTGGYGTPSPEYPSEVRSVGDIPKDINGVEIRNLLDDIGLASSPESEWSRIPDNVSTRTGFKFTLSTEFKTTLSTVGYLITPVDNGLNYRVVLTQELPAIKTVEFVNANNAVTIRTIDFSGGGDVYFYIFINRTTEATFEQAMEVFKHFRFMVTKATVIDEYRPYIGENNGLVKIESSGVNKVDVGQRPVYDAGTDNINIITWTPQEIILDQKGGGASYAYANVNLIAGKTYSFYCRAQVVTIEGSPTTGETIIGFRKYPQSGMMYGPTGVVRDATFHDCYSKVELPEDVSLMLYVNSTSSSGGNVRLIVKDLMVVEGDRTLQEMKALKYQPYHQQITWIPLREPLRGLPDGRTDTLDRDGNVIQYIVCSGVEQYSIVQESDQAFEGNLFWTSFKDGNYVGIAKKYNGVYCNIMKFKQTAPLQYGVSASPLFNVIYFNLKGKLSENTVDLARKFLNDNNAVFYFTLRTPITYQIPAIYIETYEPVTNVRCMNEVKPSTMGLDYKLAISSLIKRLEALETTAVTEVNKNV